MQSPPDSPFGEPHPPTRYARSGGVNIAYQVVDHARPALDLIVVPGRISHVEYVWEDPLIAYYLSPLASFSRLIVFDKCGTGLSAHPAPPKWSQKGR